MVALIEIIFHLLIHWRAGIATFLALIVAFIAVNTTSAFTGGYAIGLVLLGLCVGIFWEASAASKKR